MSSPLKCRVPTHLGNFTDDSANDTCGEPAAVGLVVASIDISKRDILELVPLCQDHAPETVNEMSNTGNIADWTVVSLAYGASVGDLR